MLSWHGRKLSISGKFNFLINLSYIFQFLIHYPEIQSLSLFLISNLFFIIHIHQGSRLTIGETLCMVCIPLIGLAEALFCSLAGCFDFRSSKLKKKEKEKKMFSTFQEILALANDSPCSFLHSLSSFFVCLVNHNYYYF